MTSFWRQTFEDFELLEEKLFERTFQANKYNHHN